MKKALLAAAAACLIFFVYTGIRSLSPRSPAPLPPPAATAPAPAENPPLVSAVQASLRDAASRARIEGELAKGADANALDRSGRPALTLAVRNGDIAAMELLLAKGADPNRRDRDMQWTPLMHAAYLAARDPKLLPTMDLLLAKGADPNADKDATTALHIAVNNLDAKATDASVIEHLLRAGAKPEGVPATSPTSFAAPPIVLAAWNGKTAAALALARGGANVENAIRTARTHGHADLVAALEKLPRPGAKPAAKKILPHRRSR